MTTSGRTEEMIATLRHLMAPEDREVDFSMPSMLRDVPSFSSSDSDNQRAVIDYGELGGRSSGDR